MARLFVVIGCAICVGVGFGLTRTQIEFWGVTEQFTVFQRTIDAEESSAGPSEDLESGEAAVPVAAFQGPTTHNFGSLDKGQKGSHDFVVKNEGTGPLTITLTNTSCKCTLSELRGKKKTVMPGQSFPINLTWKSEDYAKKFRQSATIETNDPARRIIVLYVEGVFLQPIRPEPANIVFSNTTPSQESVSRIKLYGYKFDDVEIEKFEFTDEKSREFFEASATPLSKEDLAREVNSLCGYLIEVKTKKGLPLGPLRQTLKITTNKEVMEIPISGRVTGEFVISLVGSKYSFNEEKNQIRFGKLGGESDVSVDLVLSTGRKFADAIKISMDSKETYPSSDHIRVDIQYDKFRRIGRLYQYPIRVTIPRDCPNVELLGPLEQNLGRFVIHTTHPTEKKIEIYVRFAKTR
ncbi:MAG: DUF1573 domain-containing protein [Planctomycetota bacterium]|nr:DUF1573 domain-containing protein [Planctomycetota bacterium]